MVNLTLAADSAKKIGPKRWFQHRPALTNTRKDRAMADRELPSPELLRKLLNYDPETGALTWRERSEDMFNVCEKSLTRVCKSWNKRFAGKAAFISKDSNGYAAARIFDRRYTAHRVLWAMHHGRWPTDQIDHINGIRTDNRICNLREVTNSENGKNQRLRITNTSGYTGVCLWKRTGRWMARICIDGKARALGHFDTIEEAVAARAKAEREAGFHRNHGKPIERGEHLTNEGK